MNLYIKELNETLLSLLARILSQMFGNNLRIDQGVLLMFVTQRSSVTSDSVTVVMNDLGSLMYKIFC